MGKRALLIIFVSFSCFIVPFICAQETNQSNEERLISQVLEVTGIKHQIEQIGLQAQNQTFLKNSNIDKETYEKFIQLINKAYDSERFYKKIVEKFKEKFNEKYLEEILEKFQTPLFRKIHQLETKLYSPQVYSELREFVLQLDSNPPSPQRKMLIQKLIKTTKAIEFGTQVQAESFQIFIKAINSVQPPENRLKEADIEKMVSQMKSQLLSSLEKNLLTSFLYLYSPLSDQELEEYINFYSTPQAQWFNKVYIEAFKEAYAESAKIMGEELGKLFNKKNSK